LGKAPYRLLFFGRLLPYKGLDQLLEAARLLDRQGIEVTLRVVGQGPLALPDPPPNVRIERRWVAEEEIPGLFAETDLVVLPYQEASQSGVLPIAQHLGVPSVVTPVGGLLEQVAFGRTGFVAADTSAAALAATIAAILLNGESYDRMVSTLVAADGDVCWAGIADSFVAALRSRRRPDPA
jgi:glycosyltransferase involved in cell wall biosynthesis